MHHIFLNSTFISTILLHHVAMPGLGRGAIDKTWNITELEGVVLAMKR